MTQDEQDEIAAVVHLLEKVIAALGGELHLVARFPDNRNYEIDQFSQPVRSAAERE